MRALPVQDDDAALVRGMRDGRADAAAAFYDRYAKTVHALVFRLMGPDGEIDDVVQDVFVRAFESIARIQDAAALRAWVVGIAVRTVRIRFQSRARRRWLRFMAHEDVPEIAGAFPDTDAGEALREAYVILRDLDVEDRIAFLLHRVEGLGLVDGAAAADMSLSTFRRRLARGEARFFARARSRPALVAYVEATTPGEGAGEPSEAP